MANDAASKSAPTSNENTTLSNTSEQQKVPPLRIVLNSAGNQKSSTATTTVTTSTTVTTTNTTPIVSSQQQLNTKKDKAQDAKAEGAVKVGGRVRIKLGTNKQQTSGKSNGNNKSAETTAVKKVNSGGNGTVDKSVENINEDSTSNFGHLRRITRRSQRAVQSISNEDEESISSMTSTDENQNTNNQTSSDNLAAQDSEVSNSATLTSGSAAAAAGSSATNGSSNVDTPRRHKRRKVEVSESQSIDCDNLLGSQNYRLPNQNSFELYKNIRKQVDKRLKNLGNVSPKVPSGFREYMLTRGAYLLDGNKLGNGTNLFMNEDGGLNSMPMGKYRVLRHTRTNYSVPNRAKVPLGLPVNSPLYDLFVEQEKERYRMRIQHIKEREKLTLAAEQEIMRVYSQAALTAADQKEPFSACTMLKHQEIYNYMDADGVTILCKEDAQQDQVQPDGVRTRRRQHGYISPSPPTRKTSDADESNQADSSKVKAPENSTSSAENQTSDNNTQQSARSSDETAPVADKASTTTSDKSDKAKDESIAVTGVPDKCEKESVAKQADKDSSGICPITPPDNSDRLKDDQDDATKVKSDSANNDASKESESSTNQAIKTEAVSPTPTPKSDDCGLETLSTEPDQVKKAGDNQPEASDSTSEKCDTNAAGREKSVSAEGQIAMESEDSEQQPVASETGSSVSVEDRRIQNKECFLSQLQEVDDKWDKIRQEMLVRHKNEAESLHAIQKLEWEWKTKEIGACDVRMTPVIDNTLVPRLSIYPQDY